MCGFIFSRNDENIDIANLLSSIKHRGPDSTNHLKMKNIVCGFNRLAIVNNDENSEQPMVDNNKRYILLFNGELYNYKKIRRQLETDYKIKFKTTSDTEVVLNSLIIQGEKAVEEFDGIFSIVFTDLKKNETLLIRDPFGVKPLYYFYDKDILYASSEIKPLYKINNCSIDPAGTLSTLSYGVSPSSSTLFKGIKKVLPGQIVCFNDKISLSNYYAYTYNNNNCNNDDEIFEMISATVDEQKPDIKYGVMLSGGVDSTLLLALTNNESNFSGTYSVNVDHPDMSEYKWQKSANAQLNMIKNEKFIINTKNDFSIDSLLKIASLYDLPAIHPNYFGSYLLMKEASKDGLKVMISGEGADEVFLGYKWFLQNEIEFNEFLQYAKYDNLTKIFDLKTIDEPFNIKSMDIEEVFQKIYLQKWLTRQDLSGMANSIEVRVPFLGIKLATYINNLEFSNKTKNGSISKYYLKKYLERFCSNDFIYRKKIGFDYPLNDWIGEEHYNYLMDYSGDYNKNYITNIYNNRMNSYFNSRLIFVLVMYVAWLDSL